MAKQRAALRQQFHDDRVGFKNIFAFVLRQAFQINAAIIQRRIRLQSVFLPGIKVVRAMSRSGMHDAASLINVT